jgi:hypothetical protein
MKRFFSYNTRQFTATSPPFTAIITSHEYCFSVGFPAENAGFSVEKPTEKLFLGQVRRAGLVRDWLIC